MRRKREDQVNGNKKIAQRVVTSVEAVYEDLGGTIKVAE